MSNVIYVATSSFNAGIDGAIVTIRRGNTVRAGHPLLAVNPDAFKVLVPTFEHTPPPKPPVQPPKAPPVARVTPRPVTAEAKPEGNKG